MTMTRATPTGNQSALLQSLHHQFALACVPHAWTWVFQAKHPAAPPAATCQPARAPAIQSPSQSRSTPPRPSPRCGHSRARRARQTPADEHHHADVQQTLHFADFSPPPAEPPPAAADHSTPPVRQWVPLPPLRAAPPHHPPAGQAPSRAVAGYCPTTPTPPPRYRATHWPAWGCHRTPASVPACCICCLSASRPVPARRYRRAFSPGSARAEYWQRPKQS